MNAMAKRQSEWTEDELDEMLASAGRGVEAIEVEVIQSSQPLSEEEVRDLERLERTVERAFYHAGSALQELRDRRLYRDGYDSFEDYCRGRFGHSRQKANYLIMGAAIYRTLSAANCLLLPPLRVSGAAAGRSCPATTADRLERGRNGSWGQSTL
jgi:hypothetical protein